MMTEFEELIREAAAKNGYPLEKSDSLMVLATVVNRLAEDWQRVLDAALEKHRAEYEEVAHRWRTGATTQAEKVLNAGLAASREAMTKGMNEGTAKVLTLVRGHVEDVLRDALAEQKAELRKATDDFKAYVMLLAKGSGVVLVLLALLVALF